MAIMSVKIRNSEIIASEFVKSFNKYNIEPWNHSLPQTLEVEFMHHDATLQ